jgi:hypothetical protein
VGTVNVGSRAPACPPFIVALRERRPTVRQGKRPRSGRGSDRFPNPEITFLTRWGLRKANKRTSATAAMDGSYCSSFFHPNLSYSGSEPSSLRGMIVMQVSLRCKYVSELGGSLIEIQP